MTHKALVRESGANYTKFNPRTAPATVIGEQTDQKPLKKINDDYPLLNSFFGKVISSAKTLKSGNLTRLNGQTQILWPEIKDRSYNPTPSGGRKGIKKLKKQSEAKALALTNEVSLKETMTIFGAAFFGLFLILATNFSYQNIAHNAGHDTRHSIGFPCH